jgi:hypothetical protein
MAVASVGLGGSDQQHVGKRLELYLSLSLRVGRRRLGRRAVAAAGDLFVGPRTPAVLSGAHRTAAQRCRHAAGAARCRAQPLLPAAAAADGPGGDQQRGDAAFRGVQRLLRGLRARRSRYRRAASRAAGPRHHQRRLQPADAGRADAFAGQRAGRVFRRQGSVRPESRRRTRRREEGQPAAALDQGLQRGAGVSAAAAADGRRERSGGAPLRPEPAVGQRPQTAVVRRPVRQRLASESATGHRRGADQRPATPADLAGAGAAGRTAAPLERRDSGRFGLGGDLSGRAGDPAGQPRGAAGLLG